MAFVITGSGVRTARAYESAAAKAPRLVIEYVVPAPVLRTLDLVIDEGADDVEQRSTGAMLSNSTDLELVDDGGLQTVGLRFEGAGIPPRAQIVTATLKFAVDETSAGAADVVIRGEASANPAPFGAANLDVTARRTTAASAAWSIGAWPVVGEAGPVQRSPDLRAVVQEMVNAAGFASGNPLVFTISGAGKRTAEAFEGDAARAPRLHVEFLQ